MISFEFTYFILTEFQGMNNNIGISGDIIAMRKRIKSHDEIINIQEILKKKDNKKFVMVTNWKLLSFRVRFWK